MRVGPILRNVGEPSRQNMLAVARAADELGFQSLWATTHTAPVAAAMPLVPAAGRWLELSGDYLKAGTDQLILTSYGQQSRVTEELERFAAEVLPELR